MSATFRSLKLHNYRVWFIGAIVSNAGSWMQSTAQNWVVLTELTDADAAAVGITMALQFAPPLLLVPVTGWVADRFDRRKLLETTIKEGLDRLAQLDTVLEHAAQQTKEKVAVGLVEAGHLLHVGFDGGFIGTADAPLIEALQGEFAGAAAWRFAAAVGGLARAL